MNVGARKILMSGLLGAFALQTTLVYTDETPQRFEPLSELALRGRAIWHEHNCFTCHQIYGFGGFLGPDLTNVVRRADRERFDSILTRGSDAGLQMPAFHFSKEEIDALVAYFTAMDRTGTGQARAVPESDYASIDRALEAVARKHPLSGAQALGYETFRRGACVACHRLLTANNLGMVSAPDLTRVTSRLPDAQIHTTLEKGRPDLGMPPSGLERQEREAVIAWFHWLAEHRDELAVALAENTGDRGVPWWEFAPTDGDAR